MNTEQKELHNTNNFLDILSQGFKQAEEETILFERISGAKHPKAINNLGNALSLLYQAACCYWKCIGGDHSIEKLIGKVVNQAISSFQLYRGCFYDESLMLTRGIGEIANLLHLFFFFPDKIEVWKALNSRERYKQFKPSAVREMLEKNNSLVPIDKDRYGKLCEIGTHPTPSEIPGHYTGTGVPILGMIVQPVGAYVSITELSYSVGLVLVVTPKLLDLDADIAKKMKDIGLELIRSLGSFNIMNYQENLEKLAQTNK
ncbi:hypothetical protein DYU11_12570 [Fibrisoma montanum]|uniref:Uncharacterized protein n=1 Tax=Fibrisoma montanum TaxID=2305895 RepID=A0A418MBQ3_9BACT|nr:hypothetical protein [Fibrisoma montanum]RIV23797.1 hypothetical protein DYU11_12570 [Fibrisoma montanum]